MVNSKTVELELLIAVSQNRNISAHMFPQIFQHKWKLYNPTFHELIQDGLFSTETRTGLLAYELTVKGKARINDLIDEREKNVQLRLSALNQKRPEAAPALKSKVTLLKYFAHWLSSSRKVNHTELRADDREMRA
ncbi:MAG TPA: hypothetical protein VFE04_11075 [Puia sp.]|jgi:DNA-binding PadR family transcriptional regulator|nr:hypothetical protein [Puia sp.]